MKAKQCVEQKALLGLPGLGIDLGNYCRAACRARVEIMVGGVLFKKKKRGADEGGHAALHEGHIGFINYNE